MRARPSLVVAAAALATLLVATGCADRTAILVEVTSADLSVPTDIDSITIRAISVFGSSHERTYPLASSWPHSLTLIPAPQEGIGGVRIDVTGNLAGRFVVRRVVATEFVPGTVRRVSVVLARACAGVTCGDGVDCISGMCVGTPTDAGVSDAGPFDAGDSDGGAPFDAGPGDLDAPAALDAPVLPTDAPMSIDVRLDAPVAIDAGPPDAGLRDAGPPDAGPPDAPVAPSDAGSGSILFSEYVEGSGSNKVLEIYNGTSTGLVLSTCRIDLYSNGAATASQSYTFPASAGTLAAGDVFVLCHGGAAAGLVPSCDTPLGPNGGAMAFNGDDAIALVCGGTTMDIFGQIGLDPGTAWGSPPTSTLDATLRRSCSVVAGDTNGADAFTPATEWSGAPADTFGGLGTRGCP